MSGRQSARDDEGGQGLRNILDIEVKKLKLEIFDFTDESIGILKEMDSELEKASYEIERFLKDKLGQCESFLNLNVRIKTEGSLKEKILRNNYYIKHKNPQEMMLNLSDLIGARIECRFIDDELSIYRQLTKIFNLTDDGKLFYNECDENIFLKLDGKQPQIQKNGFKLFRIDGKYRIGDVFITFELQIKSLVNVFWSEIEHKILYKNYNYLIIEDFFRDIMASIKDNLGMIDRQLKILYNHLSEVDEDTNVTRRDELKGFLSKVVHSLYVNKIKSELGFMVDFKKPCDIIIEYIVRKDRKDELVDYGNNFVRILERLTEISSNKVSFSEYLEFERYIFFEDEYSKAFGEPILGVINKDFMWNLLFRILFEIEPGNNAEDFEGFINFFKDCFLENLQKNSKLKNKFDQEERSEVIDSIMHAIADVLNEAAEFNIMCFDNIESINSKVNQKVNKLKGFDDWKETGVELKESLKQDIKEIIS